MSSRRSLSLAWHDLQALQGVFVASVASVLVLLGIVYSKIRAKADQAPVRVKSSVPNS